MPDSPNKLRLLTAVPVCDGHDSAINTINLELVRRGHEVVYLGYHRPARDVVRAAVQEGVSAVGLSSYNGGHVEFFAEVAEALKPHGIGVVGGGGGTITRDDEREMTARGVDRIFPAGTPLDTMMDWLFERYGTASAGKTALSDAGGSQAAAAVSREEPPISQDGPANSQDGPPISQEEPTFSSNGPTRTSSGATGDAPDGLIADGEVARRLDANEPASGDSPARNARVIGFTGPGGAGKTTLIDELVLRFLKSHPGRVAILSHDPSIIGNGALLGDRATMIHSQHDRVFMRSLATRGQSGGLGPQTGDMLRVLKSLDFDLILIETVGTGQEALPFGDSVDRAVFVMSPEYGSRLQLQKIAMLDAADAVVVNKNDRAGATTAKNEVDARLRMGPAGRQTVFTTCAKRHRDAGVDALFDFLVSSERRGTGFQPVSENR